MTLSLSPYEGRVYAWVLRHTFGYHRLTVVVSIPTLARATAIPRTAIYRALAGLKFKGLISIHGTMAQRISITTTIPKTEG